MCIGEFLVEEKSLPQLSVPDTDGTKSLSSFSSFDVSLTFHESKFDEPGPAMPKRLTRYFSLEKDTTVVNAFESLETPLLEIAFTPQQVGEFIDAYREFLHEVDRGTFILLRDKERISAGIIIPQKSSYLAVRHYVLNSPYIVQVKDQFLFLLLKA
jgi:hypothetical protein